MTGTLRAASLASLAVVFATACSSVPDIVYTDQTSTSSGGSSGGGSSGGSSGTPQPPDWSCPDKPPPDGQGICCGNRICLKCSQSDCQKCEQEGCAGTVSAACCRKNPAQFMCRSATDC